MNKIINLINKFKPDAHDLSLGVLIGYHRLLEIGNVKYGNDFIIQETNTKRKIFCFKEIPNIEMNKKSVFYFNDIIENNKFKIEKRINIIHNLKEILNEDNYEKKSNSINV